MKPPQLRDFAKPASLDCGLGHACQFCPDEGNCSFDENLHNKALIEGRLGEIDQIILVLSNKGGVGKSTISANLAAGLAQRGFRVGVADADIHGPNQNRLFGLIGQNIRTNHNGLQTLEFDHESIKFPLKLGSLAFMLEDDTTPIIWRDAYKHDFIHHLIGSFHWGSLDYLVIDMPPGTGNELITLCDLLEGSNASAVLVSTPQALAQMDSLKAARYCRERKLPVIGAVENMSGVICPNCAEAFHPFPNAGLREALAKFEIDIVAQVPLTPEIALASDEGAPAICQASQEVVQSALAPLIDAVKKHGENSFEASVAASIEDIFAKNLESEDLQMALGQANASDKDALDAELKNLLRMEANRIHQASKGD